MQQNGDRCWGLLDTDMGDTDYWVLHQALGYHSNHWHICRMTISLFTDKESSFEQEFQSRNITCRTCLRPCRACNRCRLPSSGRTRQHGRYTDTLGSWGNPSDPPGIGHTADQRLPAGTGTDPTSHRTAESQNPPCCNRRLLSGYKRSKVKHGNKGSHS